MADDENDSKRPQSVLQKIGAGVERSIGALETGEVQQRVLGERRLQTWLLSLLTMIIAPVCGTVILTFASMPSDMRELKSSVDELKIQNAGAYRADSARRDIAQIIQRIDAGDAKDATHDARLNSLEKNQAVLTSRVGSIERRLRTHVNSLP